MATENWYAINNKAEDDAAEISIYDAIGSFGVTAAQFVGDLKQIKAKTINVRLNTPGGSLFDGTAIYNALRSHPARVVVHVDGVAASAGSFVAMSGDEVRMADNAYLMIHNARGGVMGESEDMRRYADTLDDRTTTSPACTRRRPASRRSTGGADGRRDVVHRRGGQGRRARSTRCTTAAPQAEDEDGQVLVRHHRLQQDPRPGARDVGAERAPSCPERHAGPRSGPAPRRGRRRGASCARHTNQQLAGGFAMWRLLDGS
jgi:ATP-dependent protease ClpP protease subunit